MTLTDKQAFRGHLGWICFRQTYYNPYHPICLFCYSHHPSALRRFPGGEEAAAECSRSQPSKRFTLKKLKSQPIDPHDTNLPDAETAVDHLVHVTTGASQGERRPPLEYKNRLFVS